MTGIRARLDYILKHNYTVNRIFNLSVSTVLRIIGIFVQQDKNMILFSGHSRKYNDSPRAIYEYILSNPNKYRQYKCVWALEDTLTEIPGSPIKVKADTLLYFIYSLKAKYWITCVNIERSLHYKKRSCKYLNTWHGTPFKFVGNDAIGRKDYDFSKTNYFCYASELEKQVYMRAFKVKEESLIATGLPRNDTLYNTSVNEINTIKKRLGIPLDKKIILYAPTWRDSTDGGKSCSIAPPINPNKWESMLGDEYIILFRMHAYTNRLIGIEFNDVLRDYSEYPNVNDLFKISDILISDYSASMADYCILERPIICFAYDYDEYKNSRGLYIDYLTDMPSGILKTEDEVIDYIKHIDYDLQSSLTKEMLKARLIHYGGNATEQCVKYILES